MAASPSCAEAKRVGQRRASERDAATESTHEVEREDSVDADRVDEGERVRQLLAEARALPAGHLGVDVFGADKLLVQGLEGAGRRRRAVGAEEREGGLNALDGALGGRLDGGEDVLAQFGLLLRRRKVGREEPLDVPEQRDEWLRAERVEPRDVHARAELGLQLDEVVAAGQVLVAWVLGQVGQGRREDVLKDALREGGTIESASVLVIKKHERRTSLALASWLNEP